MSDPTSTFFIQGAKSEKMLQAIRFNQEVDPKILALWAFQKPVMRERKARLLMAAMWRWRMIQNGITSSSESVHSRVAVVAEFMADNPGLDIRTIRDVSNGLIDNYGPTRIDFANGLHNMLNDRMLISNKEWDNARCCELIKDIVYNPFKDLILDRSMISTQSLQIANQAYDSYGPVKVWCDCGLGQHDRFRVKDAVKKCNRCRGLTRYDDYRISSELLCILHDSLMDDGFRCTEVLDELIKTCPYCKDAEFMVGNDRGPSSKEMKKYLQSTCYCAGSRRVPHVKGSWALDFVLGKD